MRLFLPFVLFLVAGCSGEEAKEAVAKTVAPDSGVSLGGKAVRVPGIAMSWDGQAVRVGDSWEVAQRVFPEPRHGTYPLRTLPERFGNHFEAHGWESNAGQGFGVITEEDLVVAAIYHAEDASDDYAQRLLDAQRGGSGEIQMNDVSDGTLRWDYWEDGGQRLMVLRDKGKKGTDVTVLMGDAKVLDALGATRPSASNPAVAPFLSRPPSKSGADAKS